MDCLHPHVVHLHLLYSCLIFEVRVQLEEELQDDLKWSIGIKAILHSGQSAFQAMELLDSSPFGKVCEAHRSGELQRVPSEHRILIHCLGLASSVEVMMASCILVSLRESAGRPLHHAAGARSGATSSSVPRLDVDFLCFPAAPHAGWKGPECRGGRVCIPREPCAPSHADAPKPKDSLHLWRCVRMPDVANVRHICCGMQAT